ncbi:hypothetical protein GGQ13_000312 [Salinibacter ruber]|uniref:hypothetical protein n=1 Tax=Salinibacter ruber TaxID=146919 RepID=UPI002167C3ED|nr:hypothetical protein [Salinibacter ruber]MCS4136908.1 hypothetical protein [Salinibacter ruber]
MTTVQKSIAAITLLVEFLWVFVRPVWTVTEAQITVYQAAQNIEGISSVDALNVFDQKLSFASAFGGLPRMEDGLFMMQAGEVLAGLVIGTALIGGLAVLNAPHIRRMIAPTATEESVTSE